VLLVVRLFAPPPEKRILLSDARREPSLRTLAGFFALLVELASGVLPMSGNDSRPLVRWPQNISCSLLSRNLPLLSRCLQLPIPLGVDLLLTPGQHVPSA
jgi:hypothetical protein